MTSGTKIGKANLVVANTVVTSDTPDYAIIGGTPGKILGTVNKTTGELEWYSKKTQTNSEETSDCEARYKEEIVKREKAEERLQSLEDRYAVLESRLKILEATLRPTNKLFQ